MRLKTFTGKSMQEVMGRIRSDLGPDAVIISSLQEIEGVRVTAALEGNRSRGIEEHSENTFSAVDELIHVLEAQRLPREIAENIMVRVSGLEAGMNPTNLSGILGGIFRFMPLPNPEGTRSEAPQHLMVAGPPGAGKTVVIAKLACEHLLSGSRVAIITTDGEKAGAHEQLTRFAGALNVPVAFAQDAEKLRDYLDNQFAGHLVLVDTTGLNPLSVAELESLSQIVCALRQPPVLVVPSGIDVYEAIDLAGALRELGTTCFIQTKTDCTTRFAAMLGIMAESGLHISSLGAGPSLGMRLVPATSMAVADLLRRRSKPANVHIHKETCNQNKLSPSGWGIQEVCLS